jgi:hypothetical protein
MPTRIRNLERAKEEAEQFHRELLQLEKRVNSVRESLGKAISDLFESERKSYPAVQEAALAEKVAEAVLSRLPVQSHAPTARKQYVREREAAQYMGVTVSALRRWRTLRSKSGPPFTHVGRMVLYPMTDLENHMPAGLVPRRG